MVHQQFSGSMGCYSSEQPTVQHVMEKAIETQESWNGAAYGVHVQ